MTRSKTGLFWVGMIAAVLLSLPIIHAPEGFRVYPSMALAALFFVQAWWLKKNLKDSERSQTSKNNDSLAEIEGSVSRQSYLKVKNDYGLMRRAFNHAPVAIVMIDSSRLVYDLNEAALELSDLGHEEAVGRSPGEVFKCMSVELGEICGEGPDCPHCPIRNRVNETFDTGRILIEKRAVFRTVTESGEMVVKWLMISTEKIRFNNADMVVMCLSDISSHHEVRIELSEQKRMLEHFNDIHQQIIRADSVPDLFESVVCPLVLMEPVRYCWVSQYSEERSLEELWTPGKDEWDLQLKSIYQNFDHDSIPCLVRTEAEKQLCLFDSGKEAFGNWRIFELFPDTILAISALAFSENSRGFISFILEADISDEFVSMLNSLVRDIDLKQKFLHSRYNLEKSLQHAHSAIRAKQDFLSVLSHELLTPLNPIQGYSMMLLESTHDPDSRDHLNEIIAGTERMSAVIGQMLEFLHLQNNVTQVFREDGLLLNTLEESIEPYQARRKSNTLFRVKNGQEKLCEIHAADMFSYDKRIVQSIISKLLDNAFKFTSEGFVEIIYGFKQDSDTLNIIVRDSGVGIPSDKKDFIFKEFSGIDTSNSRSYDGTGLGLAICKKYLNLLGGSIEVQSHAGHGSMFHVQIPAKRVIVDVPEKEPVQKAEAAPDFQLSECHALVVDDSSLNRKLLDAVLKKMGIDCDDAVDGQMALNKCNTIQYDLILTDIHMPFMTGEQFTRMIRMGYGKNAETVIIGVTADSSDQLKLRAMQNGFDGWILKPVTKRALEREIQRTFTNRIQKQKQQLL